MHYRVHCQPQRVVCAIGIGDASRGVTCHAYALKIFLLQQLPHGCEGEQLGLECELRAMRRQRRHFVLEVVRDIQADQLVSVCAVVLSGTDGHAA